MPQSVNNKSSIILCLNIGSSSLKFALFESGAALNTSGLPSALLRGEIDTSDNLPAVSFTRAGETPQSLKLDAVCGEAGAEVAWLIKWLMQECVPIRPTVVAHRIVHGGLHYTKATRITPQALADLDALTSLAPLHQGPGLAGVRAAQIGLPEALQVACFDTAFHAEHSDTERRYAIPREWHERGCQRYGFHGLSYDAISRRLPELMGERAQGAVVVAHLGNGASLCGMRNLRSITATMGFTALDGLVMGTRCGALDPGLILHWLQQESLSVTQVGEMLYQHSGLLGVSELSADPRQLLASSDPQAREAIDLFVASIVRHIGAVAAATGGLDALVFTGGIGTHQPAIRAAVVERLAWLGLRTDAQANAQSRQYIAGSFSSIPIFVLPADEEAVMAIQATSLLEESELSR